MQHDARVTLTELPVLVRMARRGRRFEDAAAEAGLDASTLRKATTHPHEVSLHTVQKIATWTQHSIEVEPEPVENGNGAGEEEGSAS